jgi:8-oxo-dGTP pyrophosphatase MutT (NUDIX family)
VSGIFPAATSKEHELPREALRRELLEELGIDVGVVRDRPMLQFVAAATRLDLSVWAVRAWQGEVRNRQQQVSVEVRLA